MKYDKVNPVASPWAKQKTDELVFLALLASVPADEQESYLTGMQLTTWEIEHDKDMKKIAADKKDSY